tara:strand:- start:5 stop:232 length:228 start_codon:yes stop_codon:yes gene_type:complete
MKFWQDVSSKFPFLTKLGDLFMRQGREKFSMFLRYLAKNCCYEITNLSSKNSRFKRFEANFPIVIDGLEGGRSIH